MNRILIGDVLTGLAQLPDGCVQTCVTSPPYYGLRDYGVDGQIGLESSPAEFIGRMVEVFRAVRRVLHPSGTAWVNMGDSYAGSRSVPDTNSPLLSKRNNHSQAPSAQKLIASRRRDNAEIPRSDIAFPGYKPKDMMGMPWMLAFALRADGWYLRQDIIWHKPNPMPESVTDRCTKAHEYLFLLSKSERYYYDVEAIKEPCSPNTHARMAQNVAAQNGSHRAHGEGKTNGTMKAVLAGSSRSNMPFGWGHGDQPRTAVELSAAKNNGVGFGHGYDKTTKPRARKLAADGSGTKTNASFEQATRGHVDTRNKRSVWTINTQAYKEAHFATFPEQLVEPCILAGSRPGDLVLDPFMGSGTTAVVAQRLGRNYVGCELNPDYAAMAERRIRTTQPGLALS